MISDGTWALLQGVEHKGGMRQEILGTELGMWTFGETKKIEVKIENESAEVVEFARILL
jgi:hypothetical protein